MHHLSKPPAERGAPPQWSPPKPTLTDGLRVVLEVEKTTLATEKFQNSMRACFVAVGLVRSKSTGDYVPFKSHKRGHLSSIHASIEKQDMTPVDKSLCLGDIGYQTMRAPTDQAERDAADLPIDLDAEAEVGDDEDDDDEMDDADGDESDA